MSASGFLSNKSLIEDFPARFHADFPITWRLIKKPIKNLRESSVIPANKVVVSGACPRSESNYRNPNYKMTLVAYKFQEKSVERNRIMRTQLDATFRETQILEYKKNGVKKRKFFVISNWIFLLSHRKINFCFTLKIWHRKFYGTLNGWTQFKFERRRDRPKLREKWNFPFFRIT